MEKHLELPSYTGGGNTLKIGSGQFIKVGRDPWLGDSEYFYIHMALNDEHRSLNAQDMIDQDL